MGADQQPGGGGAAGSWASGIGAGGMVVAGGSGRVAYPGSDTTLRHRCLELAIETTRTMSQFTAQGILRTAEMYYKYVTEGLTPELATEGVVTEQPDANI